MSRQRDICRIARHILGARAIEPPPGPPRRTSESVSSVAGTEAGDQVDGCGQDDRAEQIRQQGVTERGGPNRRGLQVGIGDLERHPDGECEVGEVEVSG